jgi:LysM repeat protein
MMLFVLVGAVHGSCSKDDNALQWTCHTAASATTLADLASEVHQNPTKLAEWNRMSTAHTTPIAAGASLRVPIGDLCQPYPGSWTCYSVAPGDTIVSVANGPHSLTRNVTLLRQMNSVLLWGSDDLNPGMQIKLPTPAGVLHRQDDGADAYACVPGSKKYECFIVPAGGANLTAIAAKFLTTVDVLLDMNKATLCGITTLNPNMALTVPRRPLTLAPPVLSPSSESWSSYTVVEGDALDGIASKFGTTPRQIVRWNNLMDRPLNWTTYIVLSGDTVDEIAFKHGVTGGQIVKWNNLTDPDEISAGDQMRIPELLAVGTTYVVGFIDSEFWATFQQNFSSGFLEIDTMATAFATTPDRIVKWNNVKDLDFSTVDTYVVPRGAAAGTQCEPQEGYWSCIEVPGQGQGDGYSLGTLIDESDHNIRLFIDFNEYLLDGDVAWSGTHLKVPSFDPAPCVSSADFACLPHKEVMFPPAVIVSRCLAQVPEYPKGYVSYCPSIGGGANQQACVSKPPGHAYVSCTWNTTSGVCEDICDQFAGETACNAHMRPDKGKAAPSCTWGNVSTSGLPGWVHGDDYFAEQSILDANGWPERKSGIWPQNLSKWPLQTSAALGDDDDYCTQPTSAYCPQDGTQCTSCTNKPGSHFCYKPHKGQDLVDIGKIFDVPYEVLCSLNHMSNCSCLSGEESFLQIPVE